MTAREAIFASPIGADTHNNPRQRGAASIAEPHIFVQNLFLETIKSILISDKNKYSIHYEVRNYYIQSVKLNHHNFKKKTFVEYISV